MIWAHRHNGRYKHFFCQIKKILRNHPGVERKREREDFVNAGLAAAAAATSSSTSTTNETHTEDVYSRDRLKEALLSSRHRTTRPPCQVTSSGVAGGSNRSQFNGPLLLL